MRPLFLFMLFSLLLLPVPAVADQLLQSFSNEHRDFFHLYFQDRENFEIDYTYQPKMEEDDGPGEFELNQISAKLDFMNPLSVETFLRVGGDYSLRFYDLESVTGAKTAESSMDLHRLMFNLGFGHFATNDLLLYASGSFGALTDFSGGLEDDDLAFYIQGLAVYRLNPGLQLVAGLLSSEDFEDTPIIPLLGFRTMSTNGAVHISVTLPIEAKITFNVDPQLRFYAIGTISGGEYHVEAGPEDEDFDIQLQERKIGLGMLYWLSNNLNFNLEAGALVGSELDFKVEDAGQFSGDLETGVYLTAGIGGNFN